jgi:hypothetical protein
VIAQQVSAGVHACICWSHGMCLCLAPSLAARVRNAPPEPHFCLPLLPHKHTRNNTGCLPGAQLHPVCVECRSCSGAQLWQRGSRSAGRSPGSQLRPCGQVSVCLTAAVLCLLPCAAASLVEQEGPVQGSGTSRSAFLPAWRCSYVSHGTVV